MAHTMYNPVVLPEVEDMTKWDGEPTWRLEAWIQEVQGKATAKKHPSRKITSPVSVEQS